MEDFGKVAEKWLYGASKGATHELEAESLEGIRIEHCQDGLLRCKLLIPQHLVDEHGYWRAGAIGFLIDSVVAATILSQVGHIKVTVAFDISFPSRAKVQEEVEIEGKISSHMGRLTLVEVKINKCENGELVAYSKQWTVSVGGSGTTPQIRSASSEPMTKP